MGLREKNKQEKLERIEAAARELFSERGYVATSTRAIAARAGIGTGTLFVYFKEKKDLLVHIFRTELETVTEEAFATVALEAGIVDQALHIFGAYFDYYEDDPGLARVFAKELLFIEGDQQGKVTAFTADFLGRLSRLVAAAQRSGELGPQVEPLRAAISFYSHYYMALIIWLGGHLGRAQLEQELRATLELAVRGMRA